MRLEPFHFTTEPSWKVSPLTVNVNADPPAVALLGLKEVMAGIGALTEKAAVPDVAPPGLITCAVQLDGSVPNVALTCNWVLLMNVAVLGESTPGACNRTCAPDTKPLPLIVRVCGLFEPIIGFGLTLLIHGACAAAP